MRSVILEEEFAGKQLSEVDICGFCSAAGLCGRCSGACAAVVFSLRDGIFYTLKILFHHVENFISQRPGTHCTRRKKAALLSEEGATTPKQRGKRPAIGR